MNSLDIQEIEDEEPHKTKAIYLLNENGTLSLMGAAGDDAGDVTINNLTDIFGEFKTLAIVNMEALAKLMKQTQ